MTSDKARKRAIRERMAKTGERYTTARHYALDLHRTDQCGDHTRTTPANGQALSAATAVISGDAVGHHSPSSDVALPPRVAEPGMSDAAVQRATGKVWDEWLALLDARGAAERTHPEIARYVQETFGVSGWWAQSVTVGYERARGMRAVNQRSDGFSVNASKTFPVSIERLFAAFVADDERARWLDGVHLRRRTSQPNRSARFDVLPDETRLNVNFIARGPEKATAQLQQERLRSAGEVEQSRAFWKAQLERLATYLRAVGDG